MCFQLTPINMLSQAREDHPRNDSTGNLLSRTFLKNFFSFAVFRKNHSRKTYLSGEVFSTTSAKLLTIPSSLM